MFVVNSSLAFQRAPGHVSLCLSSFKVHLLDTEKRSLWLESAASHMMPMGVTSQSPPGASPTVWMGFPRPVHSVPRQGTALKFPFVLDQTGQSLISQASVFS